MVKLLLDFEMTVGPSALAHAAHYNHTEVMEVRGERVTGSGSLAGTECPGVCTGHSTQVHSGLLHPRVVHPVAGYPLHLCCSAYLPACSAFLPAHTPCCNFVTFLHGCRC